MDSLEFQTDRNTLVVSVMCLSLDPVYTCKLNRASTVQSSSVRFETNSENTNQTEPNHAKRNRIGATSHCCASTIRFHGSVQFSSVRLGCVVQMRYYSKLEKKVR